MKTEPRILIPDWPTPENIHAAITTRIGGFSQPPYDQFNLALHVADNPDAVQKSRQLLQQHLDLLCQPQWLNQTHGIEVVEASDDGVVRDADGSYSRQPGRVCLVQTADCLPILLCNREGTQVAAIHAGWRGLAAGIVARGVSTFGSNNLMAYLGPAISQPNFEVGGDVVQAFLVHSGKWGLPAIEACFQQTDEQHWQADLYGLAKLALKAAGVSQIYGGDFCTHADAKRFYSYRRDGETGRMASLIWIQP